MSKKSVKEQTEKIKFYDNLLIISIIFFVIGLSFFIHDSLILLTTISIISLILCLSIFAWGMIYHCIKTKSFIWLAIKFIFFFMGGVHIIAILFYFTNMRKKFKKGEAIYEKT